MDGGYTGEVTATAQGRRSEGGRVSDRCLLWVHLNTLKFLPRVTLLCVN